jgi:hypothetical protein
MGRSATENKQTNKAAYFTHCSLSVQEAVITVVRAPDDGYHHPKHVELPTEMQ